MKDVNNKDINIGDKVIILYYPISAIKRNIRKTGKIIKLDYKTGLCWIQLEHTIAKLAGIHLKVID